MATTTFTSLRTNPQILCSAAPPNSRTPDPNRSKWWAPLFGWSTEPDYINSNSVKIGSGQEIESGRVRPDKKLLFRGCFTEEKAKELRRKTMESESFHDVMYHSAIAARLASDVAVEKDV